MNQLSTIEQNVYNHMKARRDQLVPYHELWSMGVNKRRAAELIYSIRNKMDAEIACVHGKGYIYTGEAPKEARALPAARPVRGPRCAECSRVLLSYEIPLGRCLKHQQRRIQSGEYIHTQVAHISALSGD
jgi:hypothetical protein